MSAFLTSRFARWGLAVFAVLAAGLLVVRAAATREVAVLPAASAASGPDRNADRARATYAMIAQDFQASSGDFREVYPPAGDDYATLWPLSQTMAGVLSLSAVPDQDVATPTLVAFEPYWGLARLATRLLSLDAPTARQRRSKVLRR